MDAETHALCANTIRGLAMDAVQRANSGHPGMPMGTADIATVLFTRFLKFDPSTPSWPDRDRFVLSAGHGSMLLYSLLHLSGYDLTLDDLKNFRQWGSKTPGHPEVGHTPGVETTTGPLGQGIANAVGMALTERFLRERFGAELCDHHTYAIVSDGDLMEGISSEAGSLAGHLKLSRLICMWDDNHISIDGSTDLSFTEDVLARFAALGWNVLRVDGHDQPSIAKALATAKAETERPTMISCRTVIGLGSPSFEGTSRTHGAPLGAAEVAATKTALGMDPEAQFAVPAAVPKAFRSHDGPEKHAAWKQRLAAHPERDLFMSWVDGDPEALLASIAWPSFPPGKGMATRKSSQACLQAIVKAAPQVIGGSADLAGSNGTQVARKAFTPESFQDAGVLHFGVREHAMAGICNGIALHGGGIPYCATFLQFHDYHRNSVRLSSLMGQRVIYIYTHDSIFLGEDGPTHQPTETLLALRSIPGLEVFRPADAQETSIAWQEALRRKHGPTALVLTRQDLPTLPNFDADAARLGAWVAADAPNPVAILLATGSEVALCLDAQVELAAAGIPVRVVSMPCRERFWRQPHAVRDAILPAGIPRISVEAAATLGWERYTAGGPTHGIDTFGASAPAEVLAEKFGFTPAHVVALVRKTLA